MFRLFPTPTIFTNDIVEVHEIEAFDKINTNTKLSTSYLILLIGSSIVCTLGLLLNATAIVIGGMIISPLMWPLMKISLGISYEKRSYVRQALILLLISIVVGVISALIITYLSPVKLVNEEILARTNPTLLDIFVALVAGTVAALALVQPRISESLAGVAIATSLMPPLCVSGIGLALGNLDIFSGALLLFLANIVSIIFIAVILFYFVGIRRSSQFSIRSKGVAFIAFTLFLTAIPLFIFLRQYSFEVFAYNRVQQTLEEGLTQISPNITLEGVRTETGTRDGEEIISVTAQLWLPEDFSINFNQRERIIAQLEHELDRKVDLNLRLQRTISVVTEQDILQRSTADRMEVAFIDQLRRINSSISIDQLSVIQNELETQDASVDDSAEEAFAQWTIDAVLRGDPSTALTIPQLEEIEKRIVAETGEAVDINVEIISRIQLQTNPDLQNQQVKSDLQRAMYETFPDIEISNITLRESENETEAVIEVKVEDQVIFDPLNIQSIKNLLQAKYAERFTLTIEVIEIEKISL